MPAVADRTEFFAALEASKLLDPDVYAAVRADAELPADPGSCGEKLVQQGVLTRYQAKQLLAGKVRGLVMPPYRLLDQLGKGGMGTVYLAEHATLKRRVALKALSRELSADPKAVERFHREARAAAALCHPNVMRVHHAGQANSTHYLVMEYVEGATLEQVLDRRGPFSPEQAAKIAVQVAAGLLHAHEKGFVHRDIKPENLMLSKAGVVKILDMGLTKDVTRADDNLTGLMDPKLILGTIDYLSPEQATQSTVDNRADIYSLGATLFTLVAGHSPYEGVPARQKLLQHQSGAVPRVSAFRSDVPDALCDVIAKMMAKKPGERFATCQEVIDALLPWASADETGEVEVVMPSGVLKPSAGRVESLTPTARDSAASTKSERRVTPEPVADPEPVTVTVSADPVADLAARVSARPQPAAKTPKALVWAAVGIAAAAATAGIVGMWMLR